MGHTYKCPFGSTSVRTAPLVKKDVILGPGPARYQQLESQPAEKGGRGQQESKPSYTFASTTSRLYSPPSIVTVTTSLSTVFHSVLHMREEKTVWRQPFCGGYPLSETPMNLPIYINLPFHSVL